MKVTSANIARLWFGADTPIRQYQIKMNPRLWAVCIYVDRTFVPPSGALQVDQYRKSDKVAFVRCVQEELQRRTILAEVA